MRWLFVTAALLLGWAIACGASDLSGEIENQIPSGHWDGGTWILKSATASIVGDTLSVRMFGQTEATCAKVPTDPDAGYILFGMPAQEGIRPLDLSFDPTDKAAQTVIFVVPSATNIVASDGVLDVTSLSASSVSLGIAARANALNDVNGKLTTSLCPP